MKKNKKAFTLIELLVTIAIISTLSSIAIVSFSGQTAKARDARRKSDLENLRQAIEMYYEDNGKYPTTDRWIENTGDGILANETGGLFDQLVPKYISKIPLDPKGSNDSIYMYYTLSAFSGDRSDLTGGGSCLWIGDSSRNRFALYATLEKPSDEDRATMLGESCDVTMKNPNWGSKNYRVSGQASY